MCGDCELEIARIDALWLRWRGVPMNLPGRLLRLVSAGELQFRVTLGSRTSPELAFTNKAAGATAIYRWLMFLKARPGLTCRRMHLHLLPTGEQSPTPKNALCTCELARFHTDGIASLSSRWSPWFLTRPSRSRPRLVIADLPCKCSENQVLPTSSCRMYLEQ